ncbi:MAG: hypothetical protein NTW87_21415 [Planctomycetota bacterium]|nr:hypothetical protein [Planctomycetota bacterium]
MARLAKDYQTYKTKPNITFVGINTCSSNTEAKLRGQVTQLKLTPFAHVLDNTGSISAAYGVDPAYVLTIVVVDGDGKIDTGVRHRGTTGPIIAVEACLPTAKGILADVKVPAGAEQAAHLYNLQQLDLMDVELAKLNQSAEAKTFKDALKKRTDDYTQKRLPELTAMADTDPLGAYFECQVFVRAFSRSKEAGGARNLISKLSGNAKVKTELEAEAAYQQVVAPELAKTTNMALYDKKIKPLMDGYLRKYGETAFATAMAGLHEQLRKSASAK